ncbi:MAG TPA: ABC transporter ATP-binding protein [Conexibacter sp.]|nr:ABC transporter ATP-binding protein [Conexibacter sp.]
MSKRFGAVQANRAIDLQIRPGEIRGLVGENGAGKSTLMAIASGLYRPDAGQVLVGGVSCDFKSCDEAIGLGINMVHQHVMLLPNCTVAQNVVLGERGSQLLRLREVEAAVEALAEQYRIAVDPRAKVESLTPTERQRVEILTALWRGRTVLILDEPTSVLGPADVQELFATMRRLAGEGCAVIFTSHKLREVVEVCDAVSVMRHGELQTTVSREEADPDVLATLMVGKALAAKADHALLGLGDDAAGRARRERGATVLRVLERSRSDDEREELRVCSGEILGIAGVEGNGQKELADALAGVTRDERRRIELAGEDVTALGPMERAARGVAYVPEDPSTSALVPAFPVSWNLGLRDYRAPALRRGRWFLSFDALRARATEAIRAFDIRGATDATRTAALSGGNQQKVVLARELDKDPKLLTVVDPSVGLDVGAAQNVHQALRAHRDRGAAIVLISTDLDEIEALSDRIAVLYRGAIVGVVERAEAERRRLGLLMTGLASRDERPLPEREEASHEVP